MRYGTTEYVLAEVLRVNRRTSTSVTRTSLLVIPIPNGLGREIGTGYGKGGEEAVETFQYRK